MLNVTAMTPIALVVIALAALAVAVFFTHIANVRRDRELTAELLELRKDQKRNAEGIALIQNEQRELRHLVEHWEEGKWRKGYDLGKEHGKNIGREELRQELAKEHKDHLAESKNDRREFAEMLSKVMGSSTDKPAATPAPSDKKPTARK